MFCHEASGDISVLIDTGAVLNVISFEFAKEHKLTLEKCRKIKVKFGNGNTSDTNLSTTLNLKQGKYSQKIEFFVADIHLPIILGLPWLSAVQITNLDWSTGVVQFYDGENLHSLIGDSSETTTSHPLRLSTLKIVLKTMNLKHGV